MKITYDKKVDAMYIYLSVSKKKITDTREISPGAVADYAGDNIVGIEILNASKVVGPKLGLKSSTKPHAAVSFAHKINPGK